MEDIGQDKTLEAQKPTPQSDGLSNALGRLVTSIEALATSFPVTTSAIREEGDRYTNKFAEFLKQHATGVEESKDAKDGTISLRFTIQIDCKEEADRLTRDVFRLRRSLSLVPRSLFVALLSTYDHFLGELIRALLLVKPELLNNSERAMRFSELTQFDSIEEARDFIIDKEIETVLRSSHADQFAWMESRFAMPLKKGLLVWPEFIEITERRNLFVHTGGIVSAQYLSVCAVNKALLSETEKGKLLGVPPEYFDRAFEVLFEIGVKLSHVLWRKLIESERQRADQNLLDITYRLICEERYRLAIVLLDFAVDVLPKHYSEDYRLRFVFNRAQAYKWSGDEDQARAKIQDEDLSAAKPTFKLAAACIYDDVDSAIEQIREMGKSGDLGIPELRQWPIFKRVRTDQKFAQAVAEVFGEPLLREEVDAKVPVTVEDQVESSTTSIDSGTSVPMEPAVTPAASGEMCASADPISSSLTSLN
jgi:hypothetical protein